MSLRALSLALASLLLLSGAAAAAEPDSAQLGQQLQRWFQRRGHPPVRLDPALAAAALENSQALAELPGLEQRQGITGYLQFLLEKHQVRDALVLALAGRFAGQPASLWPRLESYLAERAPGAELTHFGLGLTPAADRQSFTLILVRRRVELDSLRAIPGRPLQLCGQARSRAALRVLVTAPSGRVRESQPQRRGPRFCAALGLAERGRYQVEIMIDGRFGPEVASLFPLHVGEEPPRLPVQKLYPLSSLRQQEVETELLRLLQRTRRALRLPDLAVSAGLRRAARQHSLEMLERGFFGHHSPWRGSLRRRLAEEQLEYLQASENLVLSTSAQRAHDALLASPAHRRNLLDPALSHVGMGVAVDRSRGLLHITQCFARLP